MTVDQVREIQRRLREVAIGASDDGRTEDRETANDAINVIEFLFAQWDHADNTARYLRQKLAASGEQP